jgi:hypothetical protein
MAITHVAAKKLGFKLPADRRLGCIAWLSYFGKNLFGSHTLVVLNRPNRCM